MLPARCILLYGRDQHLLETRRWVLERFGCSIRMVGTIPALIETISACRVDIMILCHSLTTEECERALEEARAHVPEIKTVVLTANNTDCSRGVADDVLDSGDGPQALVEAVQALMTGP